MKAMKSIVMTGARKSKVTEIEKPQISGDQILIKVKYTGMCHSEWYPWSVAKEGETFGHEPMGTVAEVGPDVTKFKVGDRVASLGVGYREYVAVPENRAVLVPDNVSDENAAMTEAMSCMLSAVSRFPVPVAGDTIAVVGAGYMGLGAMSLLKLKGFRKIVVIDPREEARNNALKFGATEVYSPDNIPAKYLLDWKGWGGDSLTDGNEKLDTFTAGFRNVLEFTGTESGLRLAGELVSAHGLLGIGGYHNDCDRTIDFKLWNVKAFTVENCHERRTDFQMELCKRALEMLSTGYWKFDDVVTNIYSMEEFDKANEEMDNKPSGYIKALIKCSE